MPQLRRYNPQPIQPPTFCLLSKIWASLTLRCSRPLYRPRQDAECTSLRAAMITVTGRGRSGHQYKLDKARREWAATSHENQRIIRGWKEWSKEKQCSYLHDNKNYLLLPFFSTSFGHFLRGRSLKGRCNIHVYVPVCVPVRVLPLPPLTPPILWG